MHVNKHTLTQTTRKYIRMKNWDYCICTVKNSSLNQSNGETLCKTYLILWCISLTVFPLVNRHSQNSEYPLCLMFQLWSIITDQVNTTGLIIFEDKNFQGFRGYLVNLKNKYPHNFLYIRLDFFVQHVVGNSKWLFESTSKEKPKFL